MRILTKQYDYPSPIEQPDNRNNKKFLYIFLGICVLIVLATIIYFFTRPKPFCGNDVCDKTENCITCSKDCKCSSDQYCSQKTQSCITPICGNNECEPLEGSENCCIDCSCYVPGEVCNIELNKCEKKEFKISDEKIKQLINEYFERKDEKISYMDIVGISNWKNKLVKSVVVVIEGQEGFISVIVTEDEQVLEMPRHVA